MTAARLETPARASDAGEARVDARSDSGERRFDAVVVGAGFGGLGAALTLAERGARVLVCEALSYPGGCASTFRRGGCRFESGATLFSGLARDQLFARWIERYGLDVDVDWIDPLVELRAPELRLPIARRRGALLEELCLLPGAPVAGLRSFFAEQRRVADVLWEVFDSPELLPARAFDLRAFAGHARRLPRYLPLARLVGRPLVRVLERHGVADFAPLRTVLDALCQITVQCSSAEAEAPFALAAMDYYHRGTGHVRGGIGRLASGLVDAIRARGGEVRLADRVTRIDRRGGGWRVVARRGEVLCDRVVANLLPHNLRDALGLVEGEHRALDRLATRVEQGWGACMLYLVTTTPPGETRDAHHLELVQDPTRAFTEGNHLFASISSADEPGRAPEGLRTITVSTHVPMAKLRGLVGDDRGAYVRAIQDRMRTGFAALAPEWSARVIHSMTASPRTFERFTGRFAGYVGGVPRRAGLASYRGLSPRILYPGLALVGDSAFPGQSTLAAALGGVKAAERLAPTPARSG